VDLRVEQLRRFVVLAEDLNFTRAARRLHLSQQALSAQVRQLETALGTPLLVRTTRRVELTPAGDAFLQRARLAVQEVDGAVRAAREAAGRQQLLLACEIDAQWLLAERLDAFRAARPAVEVVLLYVLDVSALAALAPSRIDALAVWGEPPAGPVGGTAQVAVEDVHVVLRAEDPLARRDTVPRAALAGRTLWMWPPTTGRQSWERLVDAAGVAPEEVAIVGGPGGVGGPAQELMIQAVQDEGGATFAPASYLRRSSPAGTTARPLDPPLRIPLILCWQGAPPPALQQLLQHLHRPAPGADLRGTPGIG
jgi:DNA-binding transcriptional LysR family regulator